MRLIGLNGRLHSGKDSAFDVIESRAKLDDGLVAVRKAFADPLKISGMRALGFHGHGLNNAELVEIANLIKENGHISVSYIDDDGEGQFHTLSGREFWQFTGTEAHRAEDLGSSFGTDFWVDNLLPTIYWEQNFDGADIGVVTDVRFPNEAQRIIDLGGEVWYVDADERLAEPRSNHPSEAILPASLVTHTVDNNSTMTHFEIEVLKAYANR